MTGVFCLGDSGCSIRRVGSFGDSGGSIRRVGSCGGQWV